MVRSPGVQALPGSPACFPPPTAMHLAYLVAIGVHGYEAQQVVHMATAAQAADELRPNSLVTKDALIAGGRDQPFHANCAVLGGGARKGH